MKGILLHPPFWFLALAYVTAAAALVASVVSLVRDRRIRQPFRDKRVKLRAYRRLGWISDQEYWDMRRSLERTYSSRLHA